MKSKLSNIKAFNKSLANAGIPVEMVKGKGYFYFVTLNDSNIELESIYVCNFNQLSPEQWETELQNAISKVYEDNAK